MKEDSQRDEQTVIIATGLMIFFVVMLLGVTAVVVSEVTGVLQGSDAALGWLTVPAAVACVLYLARHRRP